MGFENISSRVKNQEPRIKKFLNMQKKESKLLGLGS